MKTETKISKSLYNNREFTYIESIIQKGNVSWEFRECVAVDGKIIDHGISVLRKVNGTLSPFQSIAGKQFWDWKDVAENYKSIGFVIESEIEPEHKIKRLMFEMNLQIVKN